MKIEAPASAHSSSVPTTPHKGESASPQSTAAVAPDAVSQVLRTAAPLVEGQDAPAELPFQKVIEQLAAEGQRVNRAFHFFFDDSSGKLVLQVMDRATDEIIIQIPSEEAVRLASSLKELAGVFLDQKV